MGSSRNDVLRKSERHGRFVDVRAVDGRRHALATTAAVAVSEEEADGRALSLAIPLHTVLDWLDGRG